MGFAKPLLTIDGQTFLQRHSRAFCGFSQTILSSNDSRIALRGATRAPDLFTCIGPLGGIHAVLTASHCERVVLVPCDMPFLTPDIAHQLLAHASGTLACVAQVGGQLEPLGCSVYSKSALPIVEKCIAQGQYKLRTCSTGLTRPSCHCLKTK